jgi:hypothetical protein
VNTVHTPNLGPALTKENTSVELMTRVVTSCWKKQGRGHSVDIQRVPITRPLSQHPMYDRCFSLHGFMDFMAQSIQPDLLLLSTGLWGKMEPSTIGGILDAVPRIKQTVGFRTTNTRANETASTFDDPLTVHFANHSNVAVANTWASAPMFLPTFPQNRCTGTSSVFFCLCL